MRSIAVIVYMYVETRSRKRHGVIEATGVEIHGINVMPSKAVQSYRST
jgi:hypothetical protein